MNRRMFLKQSAVAVTIGSAAAEQSITSLFQKETFPKEAEFVVDAATGWMLYEGTQLLDIETANGKQGTYEMTEFFYDVGYKQVTIRATFVEPTRLTEEDMAERSHLFLKWNEVPMRDIPKNPA